MTSPTVQTVNDLMKVNVFDEYHDHASVDSVVRALEEGPNIRNYFDSTSLGNFFKECKRNYLTLERKRSIREVIGFKLSKIGLQKVILLMIYSQLYLIENTDSWKNISTYRR